MEILIALVPMLAWGSIGLVSGKIGGDANQQTLGMTIGAFLFSLVVFFVVSPVITPWIFLIGFLSGLAWSVGQNGQFHGMKYMGVSVGLPLSTGFQLILNTIAGAVFFHEWTQTKDYVYGIIESVK
ncbi:TPA: glucose transporter GlcU, partial [Enterococcus faecium]|nr:glucose transporter GlcU [Enterococcus faecium]